MLRAFHVVNVQDYCVLLQPLVRAAQCSCFLSLLPFVHALVLGQSFQCLGMQDLLMLHAAQCHQAEIPCSSPQARKSELLA